MITIKSLLFKNIFVAVTLLCLPLYMYGQVAANKYDLSKINNLKNIIKEISSDAPNDSCPYDSLIDGNTTYKWTAGRNGTINLYIEFNNPTNIASIYFDLNKINSWERPNVINVYIPKDNTDDEWTEIKSETVDRTKTNWTVSLDFQVNTNKIRLECIPKETKNTLILPEISFEQINSLYSGNSIKHKRAKWFDLVKQLNLDTSVLGSFSYDEPWFNAVMSSNHNIQATHTYIDTIYMHKGEGITLALPTKNGAAYNKSSSVQTYQRWYSYRTDGTLETNHEPSSGKLVYDLLTPNPGNPGGGSPAYRFKNGYVGRPMNSSVILQAMDFYYPTDQEFKDWFPNTNVDNNWFVVACDVSGYTDFSENFVTKGDSEQGIGTIANTFETNGWYEPTLSLRVIFYIVGVDNRPENDSDSWKNGHGRLKQKDFQSSSSGKKFLE